MKIRKLANSINFWDRLNRNYSPFLILGNKHFRLEIYCRNT